MELMNKWRLDEWSAHYSRDNPKLIRMSQEEIRKAITFLRENNYPKPEDCPWEDCSALRPACKVGICQIAIGMCGDF